MNRRQFLSGLVALVIAPKVKIEQKTKPPAIKFNPTVVGKPIPIVYGSTRISYNVSFRELGIEKDALAKMTKKCLRNRIL